MQSINPEVRIYLANKEVVDHGSSVGETRGVVQFRLLYRFLSVFTTEQGTV